MRSESRDSDFIIRPTAIAFLQNPKNPHIRQKVRLLYDGGASISLLKTRVAAKLRLDHFQSHITVAGVGSIQLHRLDEVRAVLTSEDGSHVQSIKPLVVESPSPPDPACTVNILEQYGDLFDDHEFLADTFP